MQDSVRPSRSGRARADSSERGLRRGWRGRAACSAVSAARDWMSVMSSGAREWHEREAHLREDIVLDLLGDSRVRRVVV